MTIVLASASPRRRQLLANIGIEVEVRPSDVPEARGLAETPEQYVERLAREKCEAVASRFPLRWVLAADTVVVLAGEVLEKPSDEADAKRMLSALSGSEHTVLTGVCLNGPGAHGTTAVAATRVRFRTLSEAHVERYIRTGEPTDKAGAYAIQGYAAAFVDGITGSYTNVVGLPLETVVPMLEAAGAISGFPRSDRG